MAMRVPDVESEKRLAIIRGEAQLPGTVGAKGIRPRGAPFPVAAAETGYYGIPLLKEPAWTWEIPLYFFVGGAAGSAAVIGAIASYTGANRKLVRDAQWVAAAGTVLSPMLLIADLGKPARFLNMLRVFKRQSPMSVGVWVLMGFSSGAAAAAFAGYVQDRYGPSPAFKIIENAGQFVAMIFGLPFSNYTGVLIGATVIPVWNENAGELPMHFGASGLNAAVGILELMGNDRNAALNALGMGAAAMECWEGYRLEAKTQAALEPLKRGASGAVVRAGGMLSGPLPLALRIAGMFCKGSSSRKLRRLAALSSIAGSLLTRIGWVHAGHISARDWRLPLGVVGAAGQR